MGGASSVTIGYKYYLGAHLVICHGPVDSVQKVIVGDREAWVGNAANSQQIYINAPELFGGEKKEGGIQGYVDIMMGEASQAKNSYLQARLGNTIPAFRGVLSLVLRKIYICAMSAYPKPWAVKVKRIPARSWYSATCEINGSANPIHVMYETLTNSDWGMGYPTVTIDDAAFRAAALTCFNEGLGVSMILSGQASVEEFIYDVLKHANGILYTRPDTGQFSIKLLRDDYTVGSLPTYNETNVVQLEYFERPSYAEMVNEIVVSYRPQGAINDDSVTVQDLASIQAQGGIVSQTMAYPGIDTAANAARLAMRDLRQKSTPLARIRIHVNRKAWNQTIGSVFKFSWAEHGLVDIVFRALGINYGDLKDGTIVIDAIEDVFGLPSTTYIGNQPSGWSDPIQPPTDFTVRRLEEALYFDLNNSLPTADFDALTPQAAFLMAFAGEPTQYANNFELWTRLSSTSYAYSATGVPAPHGILSADITETQTAFTVTNLTATAALVAAGQYAYIDDELVRVDTIDTNTGAVTVGRGILDTVPTKHIAGARLLFAEYGKARDSAEYAQGGTLYGKMLMRTGMGLMSISGATEMSKVFTGRQGRPYAPGKLRINGLAYPSTISGYDGLTVDWTHRDRTQQNVRPFIGTEAGNVGPEAGVTYTLRILKDSDSSVIKSYTGLTGTTQVIPQPDLGDTADIRVELSSLRSGIASHQKHFPKVTRVDENGNPIVPGQVGSGAILDSYLYDGTMFIAGSTLAIGPAAAQTYVSRFYGTTDGITYQYLGTMDGANMFSKQKPGMAKGASFYLSFPKYYAASGTPASSWYFSQVSSFQKTWPPRPWSATQPIPFGTPLVVVWDAANSRFVAISSDKTVRTSTNGTSWTNLGTMTLPSVGSGWTWYVGMWLQMFKVGSYWYIAHLGKGSQFQADSVMMMRSTDLLNWSICPGSGFYNYPAAVTEGWQFWRPYAVAFRGTTMLLIGEGRRNVGGAPMKDVILRSTDGLNFDLALEDATQRGTVDAAEFSTNGFVVACTAGVRTSTDDGANWTYTAMTTPPTELRSNGSRVVASRKTKLISGSTYGNEPWYSDDGTTWTKCTINQYHDPGNMRYWRVRVLINNDSATDVQINELAFFNGATKHTGYTKSSPATGVANIDDASDATVWSATQAQIAAGNAYVTFDMGSAVPVTAVEVKSGASTTQTPNCLEIEYSSDGTNWFPCWYEDGHTWSANQNKRMERAS